MEGVDVASADGSQKLSCTDCLNIASMTRTAYLDEILFVIALETNATPSVQFHFTHTQALSLSDEGARFIGENSTL